MSHKQRERLRWLTDAGFSVRVRRPEVPAFARPGVIQLEGFRSSGHCLLYVAENGRNLTLHPDGTVGPT